MNDKNKQPFFVLDNEGNKTIMEDAAINNFKGYIKNVCAKLLSPQYYEEIKNGNIAFQSFQVIRELSKKLNLIEDARMAFKKQKTFVFTTSKGILIKAMADNEMNAKYLLCSAMDLEESDVTLIGEPEE